jgi:hypothetical protein
MTIIDTLKLARELRERAGFGQAAAEATADAINTALGDRMPSKADLDQAVDRLENRLDQASERFEHRLDQAVERLEHVIAQSIGTVDRRVDKLEARMNFMQWQIGIIAALQVAALVKLFVH